MCQVITQPLLVLLRVGFSLLIKRASLKKLSLNEEPLSSMDHSNPRGLGIGFGQPGWSFSGLPIKCALRALLVFFNLIEASCSPKLSLKGRVVTPTYEFSQRRHFAL